MTAPGALIERFLLSEQDVFYASTLAWLLDPAESHGLGAGLAHKLADFLQSTNPGAAQALRAGPVACRLGRPGRPQIRVVAGPAKLALLVTTHGMTGPRDRPPAGWAPITVAYDSSYSGKLPCWDLGKVFLWLGEVESPPRWRHFLQLFRGHLGQCLIDRRIEATPATPAPAQPTTPTQPPAQAAPPALGGGGLSFPSANSLAGGPTAAAGPAAAAPGLGGDLTGWGGGGDLTGWGGAAPAAAGGWAADLGGGGLADRWDLGADAAPAAEAPEPAPAAPDPMATLLQSGVTLNAGVTFAGQDQLINQLGAGGTPAAQRRQRGNLDKTMPHVQSTLQTLTELQKAVGYFRLYPREHPFCGEVVASCMALFKAHHERHGGLEVQLRREGVFMEDLLLVPEGVELNNLTYLLFPEGIRSLSFEPGLEEREVETFLNVLAGHDDSAASLGRDVLTSLWRGEFTHIQYLTYDQLSPSGLRTVHDPTLQDLATRIREVVARTGNDRVGDSEMTRFLEGLAPVNLVDPASWGGVPEWSARYCQSPAGVGRQALRAHLLDAFEGDLLTRSADIVSWAEQHDAYQGSPRDEANFLAGMVLNALWAGNMDGALDLVARVAASGKEGDAELMARLGSEQCLGLLARCLRELKQAGRAGEMQLKGTRYLSRLSADSLSAVAHICSLQVDPEVREVFWKVLRTRGEQAHAALTQQTVHSNHDVAREALQALAESKGGRAKAQAFLQDAREPERAKLAQEVLGKVTGTFDREKWLHVLESFPLKKDRLEAAKHLSGDTGPEAFARISKLVATKAFAKRDPDELEAVLGALAAVGGVRSIAVLKQLTERKTMLFGRDATKRLAEAAQKALFQLRKRGGS
jgi:hypothetical protein